MVTFIIIFAIVFVIVFVWRLAHPPKQPRVTPRYVPKPYIRMLNRDGSASEDAWHAYIAGLLHCVEVEDFGGFVGYVVNDRQNPTNPDAMAICRGDNNKVLGYISEKLLRDYRKWSGGETMPCVGFTYVEDGKIRGCAKILRPCSEEFLQEEFSKYLQWVAENHGTAYLPKDLSFSFDTTDGEDEELDTPGAGK